MTIRINHVNRKLYDIDDLYSKKVNSAIRLICNAEASKGIVKSNIFISKLRASLAYSDCFIINNILTENDLPVTNNIKDNVKTIVDNNLTNRLL